MESVRERRQAPGVSRRPRSGGGGERRGGRLWASKAHSGQWVPAEGEGDGGGDDVKTMRNTWLIGLLVAGLSLLVTAACGGGGSAGSDEDYVAAICKAQQSFQAALERLSQDRSIGSEQEAVAALIPAVEQLAKDFKAAKPPADVKDYHNKVAKALEDGAKALKKDKNLANLDALDPGPPPAEAGQRLQALADDNADCTFAGFRFDE